MLIPLIVACALFMENLDSTALATALPAIAASFASMMQQLSLSIGVGTGALLLHLTVAARGDEHVAAGDFAPAFFIVALVSALSALAYLRLPPDAGAEVSGRLPAVADRPRPENT